MSESFAYVQANNAVQGAQPAISFASALAEAPSAISSIAFSLFGGVLLGSFLFSGFEVPEQISFGGSQMMTVHKLPGGERVIDLMGPDDKNLEWSGVFADNQPRLRAQQLDQMRAAGQPLLLQWGPYAYTVIIADFSADTKYNDVPYRISCTVLRNEATAPSGSAPSLLGAINSDLSAAANILPAGLASTVSGAVSTVTGAVSAVVSDATSVLSTVGLAQTAVGAVQNLIPGSVGIATALTAVQTARAAVTTFQGAVEPVIASVVASAPSGGLIPSVSALPAVTGNVGALAQTMTAAGYLARTIQNLTP